MKIMLRFTALFLFVVLLSATGVFYAKVNALERDSELLGKELICLYSQLDLLQKENKILYQSQLPKDFVEELACYEVDIFEVTAYTKECGYPWDDGITFTGVEAVPYQTVAVDPEVIPLGSEILLIDFDEGGEVMQVFAQDIGSAVKGKIIDLYIGEGQVAHDAAVDWGRREMIAVYKE